MECPACHKFLREGSTSHPACGWGITREARERTACSFQGCQEPATIRYHSSSVCLEHYKALVQVRAKDWCASRGLTTIEQMAEYCSPRLADIFRKRHNGLVEF